MSESLHWTFDHARNRACLRQILGQGIFGRGGTLHYTVLPNFWNGYARGDPEAPFASVSLRKQANGDHLGYRVSYRHEASGEETIFRFSTRSDAGRSLLGNFSIHSGNSAPDLYDTMTIDGCLVDGEIHLTVNADLSFVAGSCGESICCNWTLFDSLAEIVDEGIGSVNILEDLEKIKAGIRVTRFEDFVLDLDDAGLPLHGVILHGRAEVPEYYWLTDDGRVAICVKTFSTYVLGGAA